MSDEQTSRRPVKSRGQLIFQNLAKTLVKVGFTPNQVSILSSVFALIAGWSFWLASGSQPWVAVLWLLLALVGIQGRLVCNLIDGLMAVEGGMKTKAGELFNEVPDRVSDTFIFVGAGFAVDSELTQWLGCAAALFAMATAYIRVLGASMGAPHIFAGPMAKQHRMFVMNLCAVGSVVEVLCGGWGLSILIALMIIAFGSLLTCVNRLRRIASSL